VLLPARSNAHWLPGWLQAGIGTLLVVYVLYWNVSLVPATHLDFPSYLLPGQKALQLRQHWNMFAPQPGKRDQWFVVRGTLADGSHVDALQLSAGEPGFAPPPRALRFPSWRWRLLLGRLTLPESERFHPALVAWFCRNWDRHRPATQARMHKVEVFLGWQGIPPPGGDPYPLRRKRLLAGDCPGESPAGQ